MTYVCAPSKVNVSGQCKPIFKMMKHIGLDYKVTYRFLVGTATIGKYMYQKKTAEMTCHDTMLQTVICREETKTDASFIDFYVTYSTLVTHHVREMADIENIYNKFKDKYIEDIDQKRNYQTSLHYNGYTFQPLGVISFVTFNDVEPVNDCPGSIAMVDLQFCDAVLFRISEEQADSEANLVINNMVFTSAEYLVRTNETSDAITYYAQICRDLLSFKIATTSGSYDVTFSRILLAVCVIISAQTN